MYEIINNKDNIIENKTTIRVKAIIINSKNELLLGYSHDTYQFLGGHVENEEELGKTLVREIEEEAGIVIPDVDLKPFLVRKDYTKDYPNIGTNYLSKVYYFMLCTDELPDINKTNYTYEEADGNFRLKYVPINKAEQELLDNIQNNLKANIIQNEMIQALSVYKKLDSK